MLFGGGGLMLTVVILPLIFIYSALMIGFYGHKAVGEVKTYSFRDKYFLLYNFINIVYEDAVLFKALASTLTLLLSFCIATSNHIVISMLILFIFSGLLIIFLNRVKVTAL